MRLIDIVYHRIKDEYNFQRELIDAQADEMEFLLKLMARIEKGEKGVKPTEIKTSTGNVWACGNCGHVAVVSKDYKAKYCPECGEAVNWNET